MKVVLLPGLDGTGELFEPFLEMLPKDINTQVIRYDNCKETEYEELVEYVKSQLPDEDFILIAESFSGFIAYQIALERPKNLIHILAVATFLQNPRPKLLGTIRSLCLLSLPIPKVIINKLLLNYNYSSDDNVADLLQNIIKSVPNNLLYHRLQEIKKLEKPIKKIMIPVTYIQAEGDYLVPAKSLDDWSEVSIKLKVHVVAGGHLVLQANPVRCAQVLMEIINNAEK